MGFLHRVADDIRALKDLLKRYDFGQDGRAIYKELLQNADDAGAKTLQLHLMDRGFAVGEVSNSLLTGPALVVINDGPFRPVDARNMRYATGTSKSQDVGSVGRFGLGQKSVFHLCEAWLCVGSSPDGVIACNVDPWADQEDGDPEFPDWPVFSEGDQAAIKARLGPYLQGENWFVLWLPLRQRGHRRARSGVISDWFPDMPDLAAHLADLAPLGKLLPQMGRLRRLEVVRHRHPGDEVSRDHVALSEDATTLSRPCASDRVDRSFGGSIGESTTYAGRERVELRLKLQALKAHPRWPKTLVEDAEGLRETDEQIAPQGAVTVVVAPAPDGGTLEVDWCVFLPLAETSWSRPLGPTFRKDVAIRLHGYFFPDHGRRHITGLDGDGEIGSEIHHAKQFEAAWNRQLRDGVVLPCLLPALHQALGHLDGHEQVLLIEALRAGPLVGSHLRTICETQALVRSLHPSDPPFALVPVTVRLLPVPETAATISAFRPLLQRAEEPRDARLVLETGPHLVAPGVACSWSRPHLALALAPPLDQYLDVVDVLAAVVDLVAGVREPGLRDEAAADLLRRALRSHGPQVFTSRRLQDHWRALVACLGATGVLRTGAPDALARIDDLQLSFLALPREVVERDTTTVGAQDGRLILERLSPIIEGAQPKLADAAARLAAEVVGAMGAAAVLSDPALRELPALRVWSARAAAHRNISATRLVELQAAGLAFSSTGLVRPQEAATALLTALDAPALDVVLADEALADPLRLPVLSERALADPIIRSRDLALTAAPGSRAPLLRRLLTEKVQRALASGQPPEEFAAVRRAIRFLLHGRDDHRRAPDDLWKAGRTQGLDHEAVRLVLDVTGDAWRLISEELTRDLSDEWMRLLDVRTLGQHELLGALEGLDAARLGELGRRASEAAGTFLLRSATDRPHVWRVLPLHQTVDGRRVALVSGRAWLESPDWAVPPALASLVDLVRSSTDRTIRGAQLETLESWSPSAQVSVLLVQPHPWTWAVHCLDALGALERGAWPERALADAPWLPLASGGDDGVSPASVLGLPPEATQQLASILTGNAAFVAPASLHDAVRTHPAFPGVLEALALRDEALVRALARQLAEAAPPDLCLGVRAQQLPWADALASRGLAGHPGWRLVRILQQELELDETIVSDLVPVLARPMRTAHLVRVLNDLADEAERCGEAHQRSVEVHTYLHYLEVAADRTEDFPQVLAQIRVLSRSGQWVPSERVAVSGDNLAPRFRLDVEHQRLVDRAVESGPLAPDGQTRSSEPERGPSADDVRDAAAVLERYFDPLLRRGVRQEAVGLLVALLGEGHEGSIWALADRWLHPSPVQSKWDWIFHGATKPLSTTSDGDHSMLARALYAVEVVGRDTAVVHATSLAGTPFEATLATGQAADTIFAGIAPAGVGMSRPQWLRLLPIDERQPREVLNDLLLRSVSAFVKQRLRRVLEPAKFQAQWVQLSESGQVQLTAVRRQILDSLATRLEMLRYKRHPRLAEAVTHLKRASQHAAEAEATFAGRGWADKLDAPRREAEQAQAELVRLVESDADIQTFLLEQIRGKLDEYQYGIDRVLWELIQNADDASVQLRDMLAASGGSSRASHRLRVEVQQGQVRITHWGRQINQHALAGFREGRERGWDLDLLNMMVLNTSDKSADQGTTGRFGLGFKSVYLVSDRPRVGSGQLSFEVVAGMLPCPLEHSPVRDDEWSGSEPPTVFELDLRAADLRDRLLADLRAHGGLVAVLSKAIREIELVDEDQRQVARWQPERLASLPGVEAGTLPVALGDAARQRVLVLRDDDDHPVSVALLLADGRVQHLLAGTPSIWCTSPTKEAWPLGFVINGPVAVDTGRSRVALDREETLEVFERAGTLLAASLGPLVGAMDAAWEDVAKLLGLAPERSPQAVRRFWRSVWDVLSSGREATEDARHALLRRLHGGPRGLHGLVRRHPVLPTLLPGTFDRLTTLGEVRFVAEGELQEEPVLEGVAGWTWVDEGFQPGAVVSQDVFDVLRYYEPSVRVPRVVGLAELLRGWGGTSVDVARAIDLHTVVDWLEMPFMTHRTRDEVREWMSGLYFPSRGRHGAPSRMLLLPELPETVVDGLRSLGEAERLRRLDDEHLRARFAPPDALLAEALATDPRAVRFFMSCRRLQTGRADELEAWARDADTDARRAAVLRYCIRGELGHQLCARFREHPLRWFPDRAALRRSSLVRDWPMANKVDLQNALFPLEVLDEPDQAATPPIVVENSDAIELFFERLQRWWASPEERRRVVGAYEARAWPAWLRRPLATALGEEDSDEHWLALLVLGAAQSIGWATASQHRGFLEAAHQLGWWATFADAGDDRAWMEMLRAWQDASVTELEYARWMALFPTIYQLSRHLPIYRRLLRSASRRPREMYDLQVLLAPRSDEALTGAGARFDAPPAPLNMGLHFVLRELVRLEVIEPQMHVLPGCWVPSASLLRFLRRLGLAVEDGAANLDKAEAIHEFLLDHLGVDGVHLHGAFDIPLLHVAADDDLQRRLGLEG